MNELEALNMLLRSIGASPVNSYTTSHPDAANARATMDRIRKRVQRKGWWCNIDYNMTLTPDNNNVIELSNEVSSCVFEDTQLVLRGDRVYNKYTQSGYFTDSVIAKRMIRVLAWDAMPDIMQEYCAYYAAAEFIRDELEDANKERSFRESASASFLDMKKQELEEGQYSIFKTPRVARARGGIFPYARSNKRFFGDPDV